MKLSKKNLIIAGVFLGAILFFTVALALKPSNSGPQGAPGTPGAPINQTVSFSVKTEAISFSRLQDHLELTGNVVAQTNVAVYPDVGGKLVEVRAKIGDVVRKGETVIAVVDPSKPGSAYALSSVLSPISGVITSLSAQVGATVSTASSLATAGVLNTLNVEVQVPEKNIATLHEGQRAQLTLEAYPGELFDATVDRVYPVVDIVSRTKTVTLKLNKQESRINPGMFVNVKLLLDAEAPQLSTPEDALITRVGKTFAFVVQDDKAIKREVLKGLTVDGRSQVLSGLKEGELVVIKGQEHLDDGASVRIVGVHK